MTSEDISGAGMSVGPGVVVYVEIAYVRVSFVGAGGMLTADCRC